MPESSTLDCCVVYSVVRLRRSFNQERIEVPSDDSAVTARVKSALTADPRVRALFIDVNTSKGVVRLSGFVDSRLDADQAVSIANAVPGVKRVQDDIVIRVSRDRCP